MNIVLTNNGICTQVDVIIANPTQVDLVPQSCTTQGFVAFDVFQGKEMTYHN
jgi:hypothetical protein